MARDGKEFSLELKYRPTTFEEVIGNDKVITALKAMLSRPTGMKHTLLISGPAGCGKTTLSRIIAKELGASEIDTLEINVSNMRNIDDARSIINTCSMSPLNGKVKVYILNECHEANEHWQNAMLDVLEHPPKHVFFILVTTDPQKLIGTIKDQRTMVFTVDACRQTTLVTFLKGIVEKEGVKGYPEKLIQEIAKVANGSPRRALTILDQVIDVEDDNIALELIRENEIGDSAELKELLKALSDGKGWAVVRPILTNMKELQDKNGEGIRMSILNWCTAILLRSEKGNERASDLISLFSEVKFPKKAEIVNLCFLASK